MQALPGVGKPIIHPRRSFGVLGAADQSVPLQFPQVLRQHLLRNLVATAFQLGEAQHDFVAQPLPEQLG